MKNILGILTSLMLTQATVFSQSRADLSFSIKTTDRNFVQVKDSLYACRFECTNNDFRAFLNDLLQENRKTE